MSGRTLVLSHYEAGELMSMAECISVQEELFALNGRGKAWVGASGGVHPDPQRAHPLHGRISCGGIDPDWFGIKMAANGESGKSPEDRPRMQILALYRADTLCPVALIEWNTMGILRTGAGAAVATKHLARPNSHVIGVLGTGAISRFGLLAHAALNWPAEKVLIFGRDSDRRKRFAEEMAQQTRYKVEAVADAEALVRQSEILITGTSSFSPALKAEWVQPGTHINALGRASELDPSLLLRSRNIADAPIEAIGHGKLSQAIAAGVVTAEACHAGLGEVVIGAKPGRTSDDQITVYDSSGLCIQDIATGVRILWSAQERGVGKAVEFHHDVSLW